MPRKLTHVEVFYIENNVDMPVELLANQMKGVGKKAIQEVVDTVKAKLASTPVVTAPAVPPEKQPETLTTDEKGKSILPASIDEESEKQRQEIINSHRVGNLFARQKGVVVMTEAASELADEKKKLARDGRLRDARDTLKVKTDPNFTSTNKDKIHVIRK